MKQPFEMLWEEDGLTLLRTRNETGQPVLSLGAAEGPLLPSSLRRLRHAYSLRDALDPSWAARPASLTEGRTRAELVCHDPGGELLARLVGQPWAVPEFLRAAIGVTSALGRLHASGLIHKDIKPANVLYDPVGGRAWFTGFNVATRVPRERQAPSLPAIIAGTLAYMAPEQTGRMNRSIDSRSDLYSLGVLLYELLVGSVPFNASDAMELIHCHIARRAVPPSERSAQVPPAVSAIVMKLLAKTAEDRYQTAAGVEADLRRCEAEWVSRSSIQPFALGSHDASDRLLVPEKLYGREAEVEALLGAFDRVAARGNPELVLLSGYSGIGKSSLVNELHKVLARSRGLFASGKFDQYKRDIPYASVAQAFQGLVREILGQSDESVERWRRSLQAAVGAHGQLLVNLLPELELIIGKQPSVGELPQEDAQRRFHVTFRRFVAVFAERAHPLALFLDDLQWLDRATLDLVEHLVSDPQTGHLLVVGAYRDNEIPPTHPLVRTLAAVRKTHAAITEIVLSPLSEADVLALVSGALPSTRAFIAPLAELVHEKTGGNPFFAIQFLSALVDERLLTFDVAGNSWLWDIEGIRAKGFTDNVLALVGSKLERLPAETRHVLKHFACLGNSAELSLLGRVCGLPEAEVSAALWPAVRAGLVARAESGYTFTHDRVEEAAYALVRETERAASHLEIGRTLLKRAGREKVEDEIFEIVNQLNRGAALIDSPEERMQLAELNLSAGRRARSATAYASALNYLAAGRALLSEGSWRHHYPAKMAIELDWAECAFLSGDLAGAESVLAGLSARATNDIDRAAVTRLHVTVCSALDRHVEAIEVGLAYLRLNGIDWPLHPSSEQVKHEYDRIWQRLGDRSIESLIDLPRLADADRRAKLDVITAFVAPAIFVDENLNGLALSYVVNESLEHGNSDASCFAYVMLARVMGGHFGDPAAAYRFGKLAFDLVERTGFDRYKARVHSVFGLLVNPWSKHVASSESLGRRAFEIAQDTGDLTFAAYSCTCVITILLASGKPLLEVQSETESALSFARHSKFGVVVELLTGQLRLVRQLRGLTPDFAAFSDSDFDEARYEQHLESSPSLVMPTFWYWVRKLQGRVLAGRYPDALAAASKASALLWTSASFLEIAEYHFYAGLAVAANFGAASRDGQVQHLEALAAHHAQFESWARNCPTNFEHRTALLAAEIARIEGRVLDAMRNYETAIRSARKHGFPHDEAVVHERAFEFHRQHDFDTIADTYLRQAYACYARWGATGKLRQLLEAHPQLAVNSAESTRGDGQAQNEHLDLATVVKTSQAVSGQIGLARVVDSLMRLVLQHAGAERGLLLLFERMVLSTEAEATSARETVEVRLGRRPVTPSALPNSMLNYVLRTHETVLLDDAQAPNQFFADPYFTDRRCRSVLCLPLLKQSDLVGVLYLENTLAPQAFTPARVEVLKLLASQAAISIENASLGEKESLLKEVHHRVKNNLQLISSLLNLQATRIADPAVAALFADCRNRVRSMALVHENLYRAGNFSKIPMASHLQMLCDQLSRAYGSSAQPVTMTLDVGDIQLEMSPAISCGLIINELVSNALKHAFADRAGGRVQVVLQQSTAGDYELSVADDGVGLPPHVDVGRTDSLGLQLIRDLADQLHAAVTVTRDNGTTFVLRFSGSAATERLG
jgi:predicted ATPase/two-component sensor histidine kinase